MRKSLPLIEIFGALATVFGGIGISARLGLVERRISNLEKTVKLQRIILYLLIGIDLGALAWEHWE